MAEIFETKHGKVTASATYFSAALMQEVFSLTLIKPENEHNGYGVSREFPASLGLSPALYNQFADVASALL